MSVDFFHPRFVPTLRAQDDPRLSIPFLLSPSSRCRAFAVVKRLRALLSTWSPAFTRVFFRIGSFREPDFTPRQITYLSSLRTQGIGLLRGGASHEPNANPAAPSPGLSKHIKTTHKPMLYTTKQKMIYTFSTSVKEHRPQLRRGGELEQEEGVVVDRFRD